MPEFTGHRDIRAYIRTIWRWKLLIVVLVVGAPLVAYALERGKAKTYAASTLIAFTNPSANSNFTLPTGNSVYSTGNVEAIAQLVTTSPIATIAGDLMKPPVNGETIVGDVSASADVTTNFITISATAGNPVLAANIANAFAKALNANENDVTRGDIQKAIGSYQSELARMSPTNANYASLKQQLLAAQSAIQTPPNGIAQLNKAKPNYTPTGPHVRRAVELGLVVGILLAVALVMVLDSADRRLRSPDELEAFTKLPLLAAIAPSAFASEIDTKAVDEEAFHTLRTSLTYFTVDEKIRSVLITSPGEQEGKSTVAVRLAIASARAGLDVVLVDADLRRGGASEKLGLRTKQGLGLVLAEQRPPESALTELSTGPEAVGRLRVLPAGPPPPNPAALISSNAMRDLVSILEHQTDLVVIDTPAALAVSDAVPLLQNVSGVVLVARMNRSSRDTVQRLHKIILSTHARLLGTVATGVTSGPGYEKYSAEYYRHDDDASTRRRKKNPGNPPTEMSSRANGSGPQQSDGVAPLRIGPDGSDSSN